jgi:hypothetical protein
VAGAQVVERVKQEDSDKTGIDTELALGRAVGKLVIERGEKDGSQ